MKKNYRLQIQIIDLSQNSGLVILNRLRLRESRKRQRDTPRGLALSRRIQRNAVCADRNNITNNFVTINLIAPYTGAWIEMLL